MCRWMVSIVLHNITQSNMCTWMSEWLLLSANSAICQLYHGKNRLIKSPKQSLGDLMFLLRFLLFLFLLHHPDCCRVMYCYSTFLFHYYYSSYYSYSYYSSSTHLCPLDFSEMPWWNLVGISYAMWSCAFKGWFFQNGCRCHGNGQHARKLKNTKMIIAGYSPNRNWWNLIGTTSTSSETR